MIEQYIIKSRDLWLRRREGLIGSSDAAALIAQSPYASQYSLYCKLVTGRDGIIESERMLWGRKLEPAILDHFEQTHEITGVRNAMYVDDEHRVCASPDMVLSEGIVEAKCVDSLYRKDWETLPAYVQCQVQWQMMLTGKPVAYVAILFGGNEYDERIVYADKSKQSLLWVAAAEMWRMVDAGEPPHADESEASMLALRSVYERSVTGERELSMRLATDLMYVEKWKDEVNDRQGKIDSVKARIMQEMGECDVATVEGNIVATWRSGTRGRTFRWAR